MTNTLATIGSIERTGFIAGLSAFNQDTEPVITIDSAGSIYMANLFTDTTAGTTRVVTTKLTLEGVITFSRFYSTQTSNFAGSPAAIRVDGAGNVYTVFLDYDVATNNVGFTVLKYNSTGTLLLQRRIFFPTFTLYPTAMAVDASQNVVVSGYFFTAIGGTSSFVCSIPAALTTITFARTLNLQSIGTANQNDQIRSTSIDTVAANIYVTVDSTPVSGTSRSFVVKLTSAGAISFQRSFTVAGLQGTPSTGITDTAGNTYLVCGGSSVNTYLVKYGVTGTLTFQNQYTENNFGFHAAIGITFDNAGNPVIGSANLTSEIVQGVTGDRIGMLKLTTAGAITSSNAVLFEGATTQMFGTLQAYAATAQDANFAYYSGYGYILPSDQSSFIAKVPLTLDTTQWASGASPISPFPAANFNVKGNGYYSFTSVAGTGVDAAGAGSVTVVTFTNVVAGGTDAVGLTSANIIRSNI